MLNRYAESEQALLEGWAIRQALDDGDPGRESMYYPSELMYLYRQWSRFDLAWQWGDIALAAARLIGKDTVSYGTSLSNLSGVALQTKEYARGLPYARQAMQTWARTSGEDSTDHAWGMRDVGVLLLRMGRMEEAYGYHRRLPDTPGGLRRKPHRDANERDRHGQLVHPERQRPPGAGVRPARAGHGGAAFGGPARCRPAWP